MRDPRENRLSEVARRKRGLVTLDDLRKAGLDKHAVGRRVEAEELHPLFPGVFALGHRALTREAWHLAGVLSVGGDALLEGASACQLYDVLKRRIGKVRVVASRNARDHGRLKVRQTQRMPPHRIRKGIPDVPIEEALLGLAADPDITDDEVRSALRKSMTEDHTTFERLKRHAAQAKGRPGIRRFRTLLLNDPGPRSKSALEAAAAALLRRYGIDFEQNVPIDGLEADLLIEGVIVELDSEQFHDNPIQATEDAHRQEHWESQGRTVQRWTWDDVHARPVKTVRRLTAAVACLA